MPKLVVGMCPAMTTQVVKHLQLKGITSVLEFITTDPEKLTSLCGLSYKKVMLIRRVLLAQYSSFPSNGLALYKEILTTCSVLPSGCSNVDSILEDGVYTGEVTEIVGKSVSGKSQFCQTLAVNIAAVLEKNVLCIDTNVGWCTTRIAEISTTRHPNINISSSLSRIKLCRCLTMDDLDKALTQIRDALQQQQDVFFASMKLIIIDSLASILSPCFFSGTYVEGFAMLQNFGRRLNALAKDFNIAVVTTNIMVSSASSSNSDTYALKPALGRCWTFVPSVRLIFKPEFEPCLLSTCGDVSFVATLEKSTRSKMRTARFKISAAGVANS